MGAWGAIIMSFFGALFASLTLGWQYGWSGIALAVPFIAFVAVAGAASAGLRRPGEGLRSTARADRIIMWSSIGEGIGLFVMATVMTNLGHAELLLPGMAAVVGLHFLPMAFGIPFPPYYGIGSALLAAAITGFILPQPLGGRVAGFAAALSLLVAATAALRREARARSA